jgi:polysaccharide biosynthesis transport protein
VTPQTAAVQPPASGLHGFLAVVQRWRWMLVAATLAAGVAGYFTAASGSPEYESRAVLLVGSLSSNNDTLDAAGQLAQTYAQLATTRPVLASTARRVGVSEIRSGVEANASAVTRLLTIRVRQGDPRLAAQIANAEATELIAVAERRRGLRPGAGRLRVVDPAEPSLSPTGPQPAAIGVLAGIAGLLAALALALLLDRSGGTVKTANDLEALTGVPCVGTLSRAALRRSRADVPVVLAEPRSRAADEYRLLAAKLSASGRTSLLVMAIDGDGAVLAHNLAAALAAAGSQVALIDTGAQEGVNGRDSDPEVDADADAVDEPAMTVNGSGLPVRVNGHGSRGAPGLEVLDGAVLATKPGPDGARGVLEQVAADTDVVLMHAPPLQRSPEGLAWARAAQGTVLVAQRDRTGARELRAAIETLQLVNARLMATVLTEPPAMLRR